MGSPAATPLQHLCSSWAGLWAGWKHLPQEHSGMGQFYQQQPRANLTKVLMYTHTTQYPPPLTSMRRNSMSPEPKLLVASLMSRAASLSPSARITAAFRSCGAMEWQEGGCTTFYTRSGGSECTWQQRAVARTSFEAKQELILDPPVDAS